MKNRETREEFSSLVAEWNEKKKCEQWVHWGNTTEEAVGKFDLVSAVLFCFLFSLSVEKAEQVEVDITNTSCSTQAFINVAA